MCNVQCAMPSSPRPKKTCASLSMSYQKVLLLRDYSFSLSNAVGKLLTTVSIGSLLTRVNACVLHGAANTAIEDEIAAWDGLLSGYSREVPWAR